MFSVLILVSLDLNPFYIENNKYFYTLRTELDVSRQC